MSPPLTQKLSPIDYRLQMETVFSKGNKLLLNGRPPDQQEMVKKPNSIFGGSLCHNVMSGLLIFVFLPYFFFLNFTTYLNLNLFYIEIKYFMYECFFLHMG